MNTQIVRLEHKTDGCGIFVSSDSNNNDRCTTLDTMFECDDFGLNEIDRKHISMDSARCIIGFTYEHFCAYKTIEQMKDWLTTEQIKTILNSNEYNMLLLTVSDCIIHDDQVLYKKEDVIETKIINELFL